MHALKKSPKVWLRPTRANWPWLPLKSASRLNWQAHATKVKSALPMSRRRKPSGFKSSRNVKRIANEPTALVGKFARRAGFQESSLIFGAQLVRQDYLGNPTPILTPPHVHLE